MGVIKSAFCKGILLWILRSRHPSCKDIPADAIISCRDELSLLAETIVTFVMVLICAVTRLSVECQLKDWLSIHSHSTQMSNFIFRLSVLTKGQINIMNLFRNSGKILSYLSSFTLPSHCVQNKSSNAWGWYVSTSFFLYKTSLKYLLMCCKSKSIPWQTS